MPWLHVAADFFGGVLLANFFPHYLAGVSGERFYTPFADPPFRGLSSPVVNVLYAHGNLAAAVALLALAGDVTPRPSAATAVAAAGFALWSVFVARSVSRLRGSSPSP